MVKIVLTLSHKGEEKGESIVRAIEKLLKEKGEWAIEHAIETRTELKPVITKRILSSMDDWEEEIQQERLEDKFYHFHYPIEPILDSISNKKKG